MLKKFLGPNVDIVQGVTGNRYADGKIKRLVNMGPIALFSNYNLTTRSGKHLKDICHAHVDFLMFKVKTSTKGTDDLRLSQVLLYYSMIKHKQVQ